MIHLRCLKCAIALFVNVESQDQLLQPAPAPGSVVPRAPPPPPPLPTRATCPPPLGTPQPIPRSPRPPPRSRALLPSPGSCEQIPPSHARRLCCVQAMTWVCATWLLCCCGHFVLALEERGSLAGYCAGALWLVCSWGWSAG